MGMFTKEDLSPYFSPPDSSLSVKDTPLVSVRVYPDDADLAQGLAMETGRSIAEVIRQALTDMNECPKAWVWPEEEGVIT